MLTPAKPLALGALVLLGCETPIPDPPPKPSPTEIPVAPPRALGALAAGTDGAPKVSLHPDAAIPLPMSPEFESAPAEPGPSAMPEPAPSGGGSVPL